jgi:hypothetical protein
MFFKTADEETHVPSEALSFEQLSASLQHNLEISRSLWDRESLLVDLNVEYVNFDSIAQPYLEFERTFRLLEPVKLEIQKTLLRYGIAPLHLLSGRGHHFVWRIQRTSDCFTRFAHFGRMPSSLRHRYDQRISPSGEKIDHALGNAFIALGRVVEYFAAETKKRCAPMLELPIELSPIEVGPGKRGREMISFDISQYGDPLYARFTRTAYSRYVGVPEESGIITDEVDSSLPPLFVIPVYEMNLSEAIHAMRDPKAVVALASYAPAKIPDCSDGTENLLNSYLSSDLAVFHCDFYAEEPEPPER